MSKAQGPGLIFHSENLDFHHHKGSVVKGTQHTIAKASQKKGGGFGQRKALQDISNKSSVRQEASTKKKSVSSKEFNVADERAFHNHEKCIASRKSESAQYYDEFLFEQDSIFPDTPPKPKQAQAGCATSPKYLELEPIPEVEIDDMSWCPSPIGSPSPSPFGSISQNLDIHLKGSDIKGTFNTISKASQKKGGEGLGQLKALEDISNRSSLRQDASVKKKSLPTEEFNVAEFNVAEERFLHDHEKCIGSRKSDIDQYYNAFLLEQDFLFPNTPPKPKQTQAGYASPPSYLELEAIPELEIPEMTWCPSPICSPPQSPMRFELPEFVLKPIDC